MTFAYDGLQINLLDTPGHQDFSEDTYRTLAAADNAVMLVDGAKGIEEQTRKLFAVARLRGLPIFTVRAGLRCCMLRLFVTAFSATATHDHRNSTIHSSPHRMHSNTQQQHPHNTNTNNIHTTTTQQHLGRQQARQALAQRL